MVTSAPNYNGPPIFAGGYRAFFFLAALWALVSVVLWVVYLADAWGAADEVDVTLWHGHTLIFGYGGAVVAGFALTAIPNWTGRPPVRGWQLLMLVVPWLVARGAELSLLTGSGSEVVRALGEVLFFSLFVIVAAREVIGGKNWRNLKVVIIFAIFLIVAVLANLNRLDIIALPFAGWVAGLAVLLTLITVIGGRIIPAFTGNWMRQQKMTPLPVSFNWFDAVVVFVTVATLVALIADWDSSVSCRLAVMAAVLHVVRLARWQGWRAAGSPIVVVLHVSYLWVPIGFGVTAVSLLGLADIDTLSAMHAWTIGAIGSTTLAVMTRASLGHAGLPLRDSCLLTCLYMAVNLSALFRVFAVYTGEYYALTVAIAGVLWCLAFLLFLIGFSSIHWRR